MRVAMVQGSADSSLDGVADYVAHLVPALRDLGIDVAQVRFDSPEATGARLRRMRPDVVHVQFAPSAYGFSDRVARLPVDAPLVTTLHEYGEHLVRHSKEIVVTNRTHARQLLAGTGRRARQIPLAPNVPALDVPARRIAETTAVFFGFVHPVKGTRYLIEAVEQLPELRLVVIGGFTSLALPEDEAAAHRAELAALAGDRVEFTGHLPAPEVSALLHGADVAVLPFTAGVTTKSGALLSVLAHGLPTLVTQADEPDPELVDGRTVAVIPDRRSTSAIVATLRRVLSDPVLRERLSTQGRAMAAGRGWPQIARQHAEVYERVVAGG
jgi:glycosyltransferase involved in cell wall biosynthesis